MKFSVAAIPLFALIAAALPSEVIRRGANDGTVDLIGELEGFRSNFYTINGHKTIGYGHDCVEKQDCGSINAPISKSEGAALLKKDLAGFEKCVCQMDNAKDLNANQYGALVSFAYNSGCGGVQSWWHGAMAKKNFDGICEALPTTNTLDGLLTSRRKKESAFCSKPTTEKSGC
ncbi:lysozyme-like domain-containing protein [Aspergillus leporis]|uniref:Lysozyme-like domain-containing protein n=1 Tax=Aspergillus leporis TaxID=41062 RepID=A0A5N5WJU3_9EURO|nr:lysozyme-like domain-containing protein [Aspergillus leporis]